jgi:hypothetical protein
VTNITDSPLNLGADDWTIECWLRLDAGAEHEGTLFEVGSGLRGADDPVTRFSVLPQENAFAIASLSLTAGESTALGTRRVEFANPEGPPGGIAFVQSTTLAMNGTTLPRATWFHVALVHAAAAGGVRLFVDGRQRAVARLKMDPLPRSDEAYACIGCDRRGARPFAGAIDELRISNHAEYTRDFPLSERQHCQPRPRSGPTLGKASMLGRSLR